MSIYSLYLNCLKTLIVIQNLIRTVEEKEQMATEREEIYSQIVKAGKRTYFFDVKTTRSNDYYLTITESKRKFKDEGYSYEKHKIFLYKEDFNKFASALGLTIDHIKTELMPEFDFTQFDRDDDSDDDLSWD